MRIVKLILLMIAIVMIIGCPQGVFAADNNIITNATFVARTVTAGATIKSIAIDLGRQFKPDGFFSLQVTATGTGTVQITYELSNDGVTFVVPGTATDIVTAHTAGSDIYSFAPMMAKYIKIVLYESGGVNPIIVTATLAVQ